VNTAINGIHVSAEMPPMCSPLPKVPRTEHKEWPEKGSFHCDYFGSKNTVTKTQVNLAVNIMEPRIVLPTASPNQVYVSVSALDAGHITLPEHLFVTDTDPLNRVTVPSLSFLIQHPSPTRTTDSLDSGTHTNLVFDLGVKRDISKYAPAQQTHISQRHPLILSPDCADSLRAGGLDPANEVDAVILSHVHWDHVGTASDFTKAQFFVGSGTMHILHHGAGPYYPAEIFVGDEVPFEKTLEFPPVPSRPEDHTRAVDATRQTKHKWVEAQEDSQSHAMLDFYGDGSLFVVDAPGHLYGHVNLLARTGPKRWIYLGGDCCHDPRILTGEKGIALYDNGSGGLRSVHVDITAAKKTVGTVGRLMTEQVTEIGGGTANIEVIVAHDREWRQKNLHRFWPSYL